MFSKCISVKKWFHKCHTKEIEQNLPQGLSSLTCGNQIPQAAYFETKKNQKKGKKYIFIKVIYATF